MVGAVVFACLAAVGLAAPPASAGESAGRGVWVSGGILFYSAPADVESNVTVGLGVTDFLIRDVVPIPIGAGCRPSGPTLSFVFCDATGVTVVSIMVYDRNDRVEIQAPVAARIYGDDGNDSLWGNSFDDVLYGDEGNDSLHGLGGDDELYGGPGSDVLDGGDGFYDMVTYNGSTVGVTADLEGDADDGAPGENDTISSDVEILIGSAYNDTLIGNDQMNFLYGDRGADLLRGMGGNDHLFGDRAGWGTLDGDSFSGGTGRDTVYYTDHTAAQRVFADADGVLFDDGATGERDSIGFDVENIVGTPGPDFLTGNDSANSIWGGGGDDVITGIDGPDRLYGEAGNDTIYGGEGDDLLEGGDGNDKLFGQRGVDVLHGGAGTNTCDEACD